MERTWYHPGMYSVLELCHEEFDRLTAICLRVSDGSITKSMSQSHIFYYSSKPTKTTVTA